MNLANTSLLNGIGVAVKVCTGLVLNKILAVYVGPAGYAIIGQFQNAVSIVLSLAGGIAATGVTQATAQHFDDEARQYTVWQTAIRLSLFASLISGISLLFIGETLADWLLHRTDMHTVFVWLAFTLPVMTVNTLLMAIINGKKEVRIYVAANIAGSITGMFVTGFLAFNFGLYGALVAFAINPSIGLLTTGALVARRNWFKSRFLWGAIDRSALLELSGFGLMALTSALTSPVTQMLILNHLVTNVGIFDAGYWQASWRISGMYSMLVTTTMTLYCIPSLAGLRTAHELKAEITKIYRFFLPLSIVLALIIFLLRDIIIDALFTPNFAPMRDLFLWQLMGDVIKTASWVLGFVIIAKGLIKYFIVVEVVSHILWILLTWLFVSIFELQGAPIAYTATHCVDLIVMAFIVRRHLLRMN